MEILEFAEPTAIDISPAPVGQQPVARVLLVEDIDYNVVLITAYLKDCGFELDFAKNGKIAVEKVMSDQPHLVLMDMQMPVMDGLEATRRIRRWEAETSKHPVPILALTAHAGDEEVAKSLEAGCTEHLTKPIRKASLLEAIWRHIDSGEIRTSPVQGIQVLVPDHLGNLRNVKNEVLTRVDSKDCNIAHQFGQALKCSGEDYGFPEIILTEAAVELAAMEANEEEIRSQILTLALYLDRMETAG